VSVPYLRFSRDARGYEKTYLIHTARRHGKPVSHVLYCFRTPPYVKVGRSALDEEAIRLLESLHPEIDFDWPQILKAQPPPTPEESPRRQKRTPVPTGGGGERAAKGRKDRPPAVSRIVEISAHLPAELEPAAEVLDQVVPSQSPHPVAMLIGAEGLARLRARHAELLVRIAERPMDEAVREAMRLEAEGLDPDRWVTEAEARQGIEEFDARSASLAARLSPRRRRRRGGRGRRRGSGTATEEGSALPATPDGEPVTPGELAEGDGDDSPV
jgi:hypothetical protein